jgi:hypothetical protein
MSLSGGNNIIQGLSGSPGYGPVDLENGDGDSIQDFTVDTTVPGKFKSTISNILSKHCSEVKNVTEEVTYPISNISKKKLRELIQKHNNELFSFMSRQDKGPYMIGLAETIFRRYGHEVPTIKGNNTNTILRDLNLDVSMCSITSLFDDGIKKLRGEGSLEDFLKQMRWLFNQYKNIGEEVLRLETILYQKIEILDKLNSRTQMITSLANNEVLPELIESFTKYADSVYRTTQIEDSYKELVEAYKKWNICRQIIDVNNNFKNETNDPQCAICLTDVVTTAIVPCGHTFCGNCVKKQNTTCYICRGTIRERIKLYFT